ncbi:ATP-dependent Clp protease ATP-binding subunit [Ignavigranum ruoffiae]|uniref:ATP-dependent Clp protease ATP-binding subunit n=1 Tax=Ignavigranum ruoffiae TaxID=89093 RepID=UPI0024ADBBE8|nr:AAA family ATPase [Ignavigranum ruoffiae]
MDEKYSARASIVLKQAKDLAILHNNPQVTDIHIGIALLQQEQSPIDKIFDYFDNDKEASLKNFNKALEHLDSKPGLKSLYYSREYQRLILIAKEISEQQYSGSIRTSHMFLALLKLDKTPTQHYLLSAGFNYDKTLDYVYQMNAEDKLNEKYLQGISEVLKQYGSDLTQEAKDGKIDPVIGMDDEINRLIQVLSRRIKNNPIIVGEPGVGKTAVVEGLAQRIINHDVPETLRNRTIFSLRISDVIAGSKLRGEFEEKLQEILDIVSNSNRRIIVFIDEIHTVVGTGASSGGMDTSNILKPMLARGEVNVIGATTMAEYSKYIRKDGALERRFQKIIVKEPSVEDTISILRGIKSKYEAYHGLKIRDEALVASATLSDRYIGDRHLPDKAIDIMDEACSMVRTEIDAMPLELDELKRKLLQLQTEKVLLEEDSKDKNQDLLNKLNIEIKLIAEKFERERKIWKSEKRSIDELRKVREEIEKIELKSNEAKRENDFEDVVNYAHVQLPRLKRKAEKLLNQSYKYNIIEEVNQNHIAEIISKNTGIPIADLNQDEIDKLLQLEDKLNQRVIGQQDAVRIISNSILRSKAGMKAPDKPIASYLFVGPTGVGKTYLAKVLTDTLYKNRESLIRLDMSEYMEKNSVTKLIGSPPGYVGYDEGGQLTEKVANQPYSVILFDEIEKANQKIFNLLLQILDEGMITDNKGRNIDFSNTVIILTSNIGFRYSDVNESFQSIEESLLEVFNPEFINRLDGIIQFHQLDKSSISKIIDLYLTEIERLMFERHLEIDLTEKAREYIISISDYQKYGSREVMRIIRNEIESLISIEILKGNISNNQTVLIDVESSKEQENKFVIK